MTLIMVSMLLSAIPGRISDSYGVSADQEEQKGANAVGAVFDLDSLAVIEIDAEKEFNADNTGIGVADGQIQAALDKAKENSEKGVLTKIIIPEGTYLLSNSLVVYSNTWIYCEEGAELKRCTPYGPLLRTDQNGIGGYDGAENIIIQGGTWNGNTDEYPSLAEFSNMRFAHCRNLLLKDLTVTNNQDGHHLEIGGASNITIENCTFTGYSGDLQKEAIQLDCINSAEVFPGYEPFDDTACENVIIRDNLFSGICRGLGSHSATVGVYYDNILIENNTFENLSGTAMIMYNYRNCTISGNTLKNCASGIEFKSMSRLPDSNFHAPAQGTMTQAIENVVSDANSVICSNDISTNATDENGYTCGIMLYGYAVSDNEVIPDHNFCISGVDIRDNRIESRGTTLVINDAANCKIDSNIFICISDGMNFRDKNNVNITDSSELEITDNLITNSARSGILMSDSSFNTLTGNTISNANFNGVNIFSDSNENILSNNVVYKPQKHGISVSADSSAQLTGNSITGAAENGITVYCNSEADCKGNKITGCNGHGVAYSLETSGEVTGNTIVKSSKDGVTITNRSENVEVLSNKISGSTGNGISVSGSSDTDIGVEGNNIDTAGKNGISVSSYSSAELKNNTIKNVKASGIAKSSNSSITLPTVSGIAKTSVSANGIGIKYSGGSTSMCGYEIYRKTGSNGKYSLVGTSAKTSFTDKKVLGQNTYYYKVRCYEKIGSQKVYGGYSSALKIVSAKTSNLSNVAISGLPDKKIWTGKAIKPALTLKNEGKTLKSGTDYTLKYSSNTNIGTAKITITGKGNYKGTVTKSFKIVPQNQKITVKADKKALKATVTVTKHASATGYQILYADNVDFKNYKSVWITKNSKAADEISGLKSGKTYYVKARDYKTVSKTKWYGSWTTAKKISV